MNLVGTPIGADEALPQRARQPGRARPRAVRHVACVGAQARRSRRRSRSATSSRSRRPASSARASRRRRAAFAEAFASEDAKEGIGAFLGRRTAALQGQVTAGAETVPPVALAELLLARRAGGRADRSGSLGAVRDPRLPHARARACGRRWTRSRSLTSTPSGASPTASGSSTEIALRRSSIARRTELTWCWRSSSGAV